MTSLSALLKAASSGEGVRWSARISDRPKVPSAPPDCVGAVNAFTARRMMRTFRSDSFMCSAISCSVGCRPSLVLQFGARPSSSRRSSPPCRRGCAPAGRC